MKIHFYIVVSGKPELEFQAELFIRSLELFGKVDHCITIATQGQISNPYLLKKAEVIYAPKTDLNPSWYSCLTCVPQKGDITIYADADMFVLDDLSPIVNPCINKQAVCGVIAYASPQIKWKKLYDGCAVDWLGRNYHHSVESDECPFYVNLGFVAVPSKVIPQLNEAMLKFLIRSENVYPGHYHRPQFAMCLSIEYLKLNKHQLPLWCNYPDLYNYLTKGANKAIVAHLLQTKSKVKSWRDLSQFKPKNRIMERVQEKLKYISKTKVV